MSKVCRILTIGPTLPSFYLDNRVENDMDYGLNLFDLDASRTTNWLSNKPKGSVVYVSFGSAACVEEKQMHEIAWGLKESNCYFLWVVRSSTEEVKLPKEYLQEISEKGLLVRWSCQIEVLSSDSVGCFFSHCGWNSTVEALSLGLPMVGMPQWTDQPMNAKLMEDVWKVGIRVKVDEEGLVGREEIAGCIKEVMEGERGNARIWQNLAKEAVSEGGTSDRCIDEFVSKFKQL
jgi:pathogen-inducible salicylic acid glucosyltransferase